MATAVQAFAGTYELDTAHSTVLFGIRHQQIATFRASFDELEARLTAEDGTIALAGEARVESVSISGAPEFREHVVRGADFSDADTHPVIRRRERAQGLDAWPRACMRRNLAPRRLGC